VQLKVSFQMPADTTVPHALDVSLQPSKGDSDIIVFSELEDGSLPRLGYSDEVGIGFDQVYVKAGDIPPAANITVEISPAKQDSVTFKVKLEVLEEGGTISERDSEVLHRIGLWDSAHHCHMHFNGQYCTMESCHVWAIHLRVFPVLLCVPSRYKSSPCLLLHTYLRVPQTSQI
jgi:hypothetical protein